METESIRGDGVVSCVTMFINGFNVQNIGWYCDDLITRGLLNFAK